MSSNREKRYAQCEARQGYPRVWKVELMKTCAANPLWCCFSIACPWCASYSLRKQTLYNDMTRYLCCGGFCPCSGRCGEQKCPEVCLALETVFCFAQSVASTRWMIQDELQIQTTKCDNCIIGTMIAAQYLACICSIAACLSGSDELNELAQLLDCIADFLWCSVCACMQTQAKEELKLRDGQGGGPPPTQAPAVQMIPGGQYQQQHQPYPQQGGYAPQQGGYPPQQGGYPPQQGGYPPQGYPPQGYPPQQQAPPGYPQR